MDKNIRIKDHIEQYVSYPKRERHVLQELSKVQKTVAIQAEHRTLLTRLIYYTSSLIACNRYLINASH